MDMIKHKGVYRLSMYSHLEQYNNKLFLKLAELRYCYAKELIKEKRRKFETVSAQEYSYYMIFKENLKMVNERRRFIKNFIKEMNKKNSSRKRKNKDLKKHLKMFFKRISMAFFVPLIAIVNVARQRLQRK